MKILIAPAEYNRFALEFGASLKDTQTLAPVRGMPVLSSSQFPFVTKCKECGGTGEGETTTMCLPCGGAGALKTIGMVDYGHRFDLITRRLPPKFKPRFPAGLVPPPPLSKGLA